MDQTWVPSMPPLLSPNLKVFGLLEALCLYQKIFFKTILKKLGNLKGKTNGAEALHKQFKNTQCYKNFLNSRHSS